MAHDISPPLQPSFPYDYEQSTNYYSENDDKFPVLINANPSNDPVVENAQHDPHYYWFLTGVTAPFYLQSTDDGKASTLYEGRISESVVKSEVSLSTNGFFKQDICFLNSSFVKSEN